MRLPLALLAVLGAGCFSTDLDPTAAGVFACSDDPGDECPDGQSCINGRCEADAPPTVVVQFPEDEQDIGLDDALGEGARRTVGITVSGTLDLVPEGGDHVFGEGHLEVSADGGPPVIVESGAGIIDVDLEFDNTLGAHRISVQAVRNDGVPYDHEGATANRLFWMGDGVTPLVGIKSPWPGQVFPLEATEIEVDAAVLGFTLQAADPTGGTAPLTGHIHIYYAQDIDTCVMDPDCDKDYLATIIGPDQPGRPTIPDSGAGSFPLSVILRNIDHTLFFFDRNPDDKLLQTIRDEVSIVRR